MAAEGSGRLRSPIEFPAPPGCSQPAVWTGKGFLVDGSPIPILSYQTGSAAWSDELTEIHEEVAGDDHYIDRASREHATEQLRRWLPTAGATIMDIGCEETQPEVSEREPGNPACSSETEHQPLQQQQTYAYHHVAGIQAPEMDLLSCWDSVPGNLPEGGVIPYEESESWEVISISA